MVAMKACVPPLSVLLFGIPTWAKWQYVEPNQFSLVPNYGPQPNFPYMVDNQHNYFHAAPDKGKSNGAVWPYSDSFENYMANLQAGRVHTDSGAKPIPHENGDVSSSRATDNTANEATEMSGRADSSFWLTTLGPLGSQPLAGSGYKFYRNVKDYGADSTGAKDAVEAINAAIADGNRCAGECGNTFTKGAIIYFPSGTYKICSPIIQLYYTQFVGDPHNLPVIKGCDSFTGIALIDTDPYIPGASGDQWYVNQNQFFRQIRNFIFDMRDMPLSTAENDQPLVPTGIHWQVSQATSLQNLQFIMPQGTDANATSHVGIFMENGSGGFVSDLTFYGGAIGWRAGSQQYTARNLRFIGCLTSIQMVWDWGFNWQQIEIYGGAIGFNISGRGGSTGQGIGSVSIIDSIISDVPVGILTSGLSGSPNIILDNLFVSKVDKIVQEDSGSTLLAGTSGNEIIDLWGTGQRYHGADGSQQTGDIKAPPKPPSLLNPSKRWYIKSRPQYEDIGVDGFLVATKEGIMNDGTGDQATAINTFLAKAKDGNKIAYFPAGIYQVGTTVFIPTGSRVQGSSWSQIQGAGFYFSDMTNPRVMVQVGEKGDVGSMEIVEMLFSVKGSTAGAIMMEWNVAAVSQGSAAMWDSHFRVGGGTGTDLDVRTCPKGSFNENCIAVSLMLHVTPQASGYFENVWTWIADHDNDMVMYDEPDKTANQISIYGARGMLIESQGPSWFYGTGSEHAVLYNYQLSNAKNVYLGHIQTESPYFQPNPVAPFPFSIARSFPNDPIFDDCTTNTCKKAWGLRVIDSTNVTVHGAGLYSFFNDYYQDCIDTHNCQERILQVKGSYNVAVFNLFTVATSIIASGIDKTAIYQNDTAQSGFTTEVSLWLPLDGLDNVDIIYVGTEIWETSTLTCSPPCMIVMPTSSLTAPTTITPDKYTTSLEYGHKGTTKDAQGNVITTFFTTTTIVTVTVTPLTVTDISFSNINYTASTTSGGLTASTSISIPPLGVPLPDGEGGTTTRTILLPPWPQITLGPPGSPGGDSPGGSPVNIGSGTYYTPFMTTVTATKSGVTTISFPDAISSTTLSCPPESEVVFQTPRVTIELACSTETEYTMAFKCQSTKVVTFLGPSAAVVTAQCSLVTQFPTPPTTIPGTTTALTTTTPLPVWTTWPDAIIEPITTAVEKPRPVIDGVELPCKLWFFFLCISWEDIHIGGWHWTLPPGIYPPGPPPPFIKLPFPFKIEGNLPNWPEITIGRDKLLTYSEEPKSCETKTASACETTTSVIVNEAVALAAKTTTSTITHCESIYGCSISDQNTHTATTTSQNCAPTPSGSDLNACRNDAIIYPSDPSNIDDLKNILVNYKDTYHIIGVSGHTGYIWVPSLDGETMNKVKTSGKAKDAYYYEQYLAMVGTDYDEDDDDDHGAKFIDTIAPDENKILDNLGQLLNGDADDSADYLELLSDTLELNSSVSPLDRRALRMEPIKYWQPSLASLPRNMVWKDKDSRSWEKSKYRFWSDDAVGKGYMVYIPMEKGVWINHPEWSGRQGALELIPQDPLNLGNINPYSEDLKSHGSGVAAQINGDQLGRCKGCTVGYFESKNKDEHPLNVPPELKLNQLYAVLKHIRDNNQNGKAVVSISNSLAPGPGKPRPELINGYRDVLKLIDAENVVIVIAAGNHANSDENVRAISRYPARFGGEDKLKNIIVVGSIDKNGYEADSSQNAPYLGMYAPGKDVNVPRDENGGYTTNVGTSFASPAVAGIAAYIRALDSPWQEQLKNPARTKQMIQFLAHSFEIALDNNPNKLKDTDPAKRKPNVWNGQVLKNNCLKDWNDPGRTGTNGWDIKGSCEGLNVNMDQMGPPPEPVTGCSGGSQAGAGSLVKRDGGSCPVGGGRPITFTSGSIPKPTCAAEGKCGGALCTGYYCNPTPTGPPPDFQDPKDPNNGKPVPTKTVPGGSTTPTPTPTSTSDPNGPCKVDDDKCKLDRGNPCVCNENGCDDQSPGCCGNASCPKCTCNESECDSASPACCASGTCAWSLTGGGGGFTSSAAKRKSNVFANSTSPESAYTFWSNNGTVGRVSRVMGFNSQYSTGCNNVAEWSDETTVKSLDTSYTNVTVFGDVCNYLAGLQTYDDVDDGAYIGALTCSKWKTAKCYKAEASKFKKCPTGNLKEELICQWF